MVLHRYLQIFEIGRPDTKRVRQLESGGETASLCLPIAPLLTTFQTRDVLVKETLAGRKNVTPQIIFETSQLYAAGALKVAVVGIQCVGFNRMLYSVALQQAQRFQSHARNKAALAKDAY